MKKNQIIKLVIAVILVGGASFYAGLHYGQNQTPATTNGRAGGFAGGAGRARGGAGGGFITGDILTADANSVTVKMRDGGSKLVFFASSTQVMKAVAGAPADLATGQSVMVVGSTNSDGSVTAQSIQIRPASSRPTTAQ